MRILHTADWHLGKNLEGRSRMEEQQQFLEDFVHLVEEKNVDMVVIAGDVYDGSNPPAQAEKMFYDTIKKISKNGERITLVIAGNHDNPERLVAAGPLAMEHGIIMAGLPKTVIQKGQYGKHRVINSGEGFFELEINGETAVILIVPYPSEKRLNEVLYHDMDGDKERLASYSDRIHNLLNMLQVHFREDTINLVVTHLFAMGSIEGGSERGIQLGGSYIVDGSCFPKTAQYIALGHVHKPQVVPGTDRKAYYSGAPIHYHKNEANAKKKKCYVIDIMAGQPFSMEEVEIKVYKPIEKWYCKSVAEAIEKCGENKEKSSWVYIEIETDHYIKDEEMKQMREQKQDIIEIYPIYKKDKTTEDEVKRTSEKSFVELFKDFFIQQKGTEADEEFVELIMNVIEGEEQEDEAAKA